mgnify:FL=1
MKRGAPNMTSVRQILCDEAARLRLIASTSPEPAAGHHWVVAAACIEHAALEVDHAERAAVHAMHLEHATGTRGGT